MKSPAIGMRHGTCQRKVVVLLDDQTFTEIRAEAITRGRSFAHVLRELVEIGIETSKSERKVKWRNQQRPATGSTRI